MTPIAPAIGQGLLVGLFPIILCAVIATDLSRRIIPNLLVAALLLGFAILACVVPVEGVGLRLAGAMVTLVAGFVLFAEEVWGAGDAKLAAALMLWIDPAQWPSFLLICALIGGVVSLFYLAHARAGLIARLPQPAGMAASLPYGVALALAGLAVHPYSALMSLT